MLGCTQMYNAGFNVLGFALGGMDAALVSLTQRILGIKLLESNCS